MDDLSSGARVLTVVTNAVQLADNIKAFKQPLEEIKITLLLAWLSSPGQNKWPLIRSYLLTLLRSSLRQCLNEDR
jgi:hypothetical protein